MRSKSHPAESRQITSSLFTVTSYFQKILIKGKRQVKSEEVISKKSSFLRMRIFWRREWDSNPRDVAVKRFSRPPRYDRFDIPAYSVLLRGFSRNRLRKAAARYARSGTFVTQSISQIPCVVKDFFPARALPPLRRFSLPESADGRFP